MHRKDETLPGRLRAALRILTALLLAGGLALAAMGLFAEALGLDNDAGWGKGRIALVALGALWLAGAALILLRGQAARMARAITGSRGLRAAQQLAQSVRANAFSRAVSRLWGCSTSRQPGGRPVRASWPYALLSAALTLLVYTWYMTSGTWTHWTPYTTYFDRLADGFLHGQLSLLEEPAPALKALPNPYDYRLRENIPHLWDVSYYNGRYYLYWGPAPALLAALVKTIAPVIVEDQYLLFFFCGGTALFLGLLIALVRDRLYSDLPAWTVFLFSLLGGLSLPLLWLVNRPSVYETAIAGGQFFLLGGAYCAARACLRDGPPGGSWLAATGLAWGAAAACRLNLALAAAVFCALLGWRFLRRAGWQAALRWLVVLLGLPLAIWAAGLAWYNAARFGSIFETGHRYQLTGPALPPDYDAVISSGYIIPSLYSYLLRPLQVQPGDFPFVFAPFLTEQMWPAFIHLPQTYYYPEPVASIFAVMPAGWLALLPLLGMIGLSWRWLNEQPVSFKPALSSDAGLVWGMSLGGSVCLLAPLLVFITTSMRYLGDVAPMLVLLAALGLWWGLRQAHRSPGLGHMLALAAVLLVLFSISISLLINFGSGEKRFETNNPALYYEIAGFFNRRP